MLIILLMMIFADLRTFLRRRHAIDCCLPPPLPRSYAIAAALRCYSAAAAMPRHAYARLLSVRDNNNIVERYMPYMSAARRALAFFMPLFFFAAAAATIFAYAEAALCRFFTLPP